ncbi:hypothetical protein E2I00_017131 [Balaenoptera physalus]|uniref:PDEase domain-containing protein n=1 Tax=Balaenoptera physalus TaxID=9770 RepID=A0A643BZB1_BALPH|nr:hypothetical protein E2I00_017131 [Balaenoptera physalus]
MPVLERYFHSAELGRRWTAPEGVLPSSLGSRPVCQQGPLPWDLPEMIRMVKLVWKSKSELQATKQRGILENEDALHSFPGDVRLRGQTGVPAERRGSYPFIDFRLLNNTTYSGEIGTKKKVKRLLSFQRYFHASRLLRGIIPQAPLHLLDEDYLGQARLIELSVYLLVMVQEDYHSQNPYHNAVHAADVTQAMHCYLKEPKLASSLTPLDIMLGLLAAAAHDVDHPGVNQPFLIKTNHHLANLYQNMSVLENHHWRSTIGMLRESRLLAHLPKEMTQDIEQQLGSLILATDINRQNEFLTRLKTHLHNKDLRLEDVHDRHFMLQVNNNNKKKSLSSLGKTLKDTIHHFNASEKKYLPWYKLER